MVGSGQWFVFGPNELVEWVGLAWERVGSGQWLCWVVLEWCGFGVLWLLYEIVMDGIWFDVGAIRS